MHETPAQLRARADALERAAQVQDLAERRERVKFLLAMELTLEEKLAAFTKCQKHAQEWLKEMLSDDGRPGKVEETLNETLLMACFGDDIFDLTAPLWYS